MYQNKPQPQIFGSKTRPDDSAQVEIVSTTKGFLGPRMTSVERLAIPAPVAGLEVYDTDANNIFVFNGTVWFQPGGIIGPATSTDNAIMRWDGLTGSAAQDSVVLVDDVGVVTGVTELNVDNIKLDGNEISTTDVNGDLTLTPDGTGKVVISSDLQVLGTTTTVDSDTLTVVDPNITINKNGNQATADTNTSGLTIEMSDATDAIIGYDSTKASKFVLGEVGTEKEIITDADTQVLTNKEFSNEVAVPASLSFHQQSTTKATKPWPNMTDAERDALTTISGAVIYNTDANELQIFDGVDWISYNIGVYFMIENGYERGFAGSPLTTTFETIKTITGGTLKALSVTNNSGNTIVVRVTIGGPQMLIAPGDVKQIGYRGVNGDIVQIATVSGTANTGNIYINFLGV